MNIILREILHPAIFLMMLLPMTAQAELITYDINIATQTVNFTGKSVQALTVGGSIPGPTLEFTEGDTLQVTFHNKMDVQTSIHWHGVLLPNDQDGVPYLTTQPIAPRSSLTFRFPITHSGTYWYHSHTGLQEQRGVYGALVFHPKAKRQDITYDREAVLVWSDWTDENPEQVLRNIKKDGDFYALKKNTVASWLKTIRLGMIKNRLQSSLTRMGPMDVSDVGYDAFLANGQKRHMIADAKPGERILVRMVNAAASSYFFTEFSGGEMTVVAADGVDIVPYKTQRLRMAIAETYDVIVTIPDDGKTYELRGSAVDGTGHALALFGTKPSIPASTIPRPNLFIMNHDNHDMAEMDKHAAMGHVMPMGEYAALKATQKTAYDSSRPQREVVLNLTGNMERYIWSFNNKTLLESDKILIRKGETVRFRLTNQTMMNHPLHLHGHFFRVLNGQGDYAPLKHTVNVPPMQTVTIEFAANEEKDWFFHCHNLYHMKAGMARVVSYQDSTAPNNDIIKKIASDPWYPSINLSTQTNMTTGDLRFSNTRNAIEIEYDYDYDDEYEADFLYARNLTRFLDLYAGGNFEREDDEIDNTALIGARYVLPLLIEADLRFDSQGQTRFGLQSDLQLTNRLNFAWEWNSEPEYRLTLSYEINKRVVLIANYDDQFQGGGGLMLRF